MMTNSRRLGYYIWLILLMLGGIYLVVSYWMFYPYKVVLIENSPIPMVNKNNQVRAGDMAAFHIISNKFIEVPAIVNRQLIDGCNIPIYSGHSNLPVGTRDEIIQVRIPSYVPPNVYKMRSTYKFQVNPVRTIIYAHDSTEFTVIK